MSKRATQTPSVSKRREEALKRKQEERRRWQIVGGIVAAVTLVALGWWLFSRMSAPEEEPVAATLLTGDRPLAALEPGAREGYYSEAPPMTIDTSKTYDAIIEMENGGEMRLRLFDDESPVTVNNFVFLANQGYYDGTTFHRVLEDFMAQGGDPSGSGAGGPGYLFADETGNGLAFDRPNLLAMANAGPNTNGSQFFITFVPTPHLNGAHTIFGELVEGEEVLSAITLRDPNRSPAESGDVIARIMIEEQ